MKRQKVAVSGMIRIGIAVMRFVNWQDAGQISEKKMTISSPRKPVPGSLTPIGLMVPCFSSSLPKFYIHLTQRFRSVRISLQIKRAAKGCGSHISDSVSCMAVGTHFKKPGRIK